MSDCRFMYENLVDGPGGLTVSSALPGAVGTPAPEALGSATCHAGGSHTGCQDQVFVVEIDGEGADGAVGQATFRWQRASAPGWEASGVPTGSAFTPLADGVAVKWAPGAGQDLYKGDRWSLLAVGRHGEQPLSDRDRDTRWRALGCATEWVQVELAEPARARAVVLGDHNLSEGATAVLKGSDTPEPGPALWSFDPAGGALSDGAGNSGSNARATGRTYIDQGVLRYAGPGESCFEDGRLSIQPAATNLLIRGEELDHPAWVKSAHAQVSPDAAAAPDGNPTADKLLATAQAGASFYLTSPSPVLADGQDHVFSIFARPAGLCWLRVQAQAKDNSLPSAYFDLANGAVGASTALAAGVEAVGAGWLRAWLRFNSHSGATTPLVRIILAEGDGDSVFDGDGASGLYLWGAQVEQGAAPTAYIPTVSAPASRAADAVSFPLPAEVAAALSPGGAGSLAAEWAPGYGGEDAVDGSSYAIVTTGSEPYGLLYASARSGGGFQAARSHDGVGVAHGSEFDDQDIEPGQVICVAVRWGYGGQFQAGEDGLWGEPESFDGSYDTTVLRLGHAPELPCHLGRIKLFGAWLELPPEVILDPWAHPASSQALAITRPHLVGFLDQTHKYWRLELSDPANPEGGLGASLFYLGGCFAPERTFAAGYAQGTVAGRRLTTSAAGKVAGNATALAVFYELSFPRLSAADAAVLEGMMAVIHDHAGGGLRPIFFTPFGDDPGGTLFCLPAASLTRRRLAGGRWELGLRLEEVVRTDV